jgi:hypothetical protein
MCDNRVKLEFFEFSAKSFQVDRRSLVVINEELFIVGCYIVLFLKKNGLIRHPNDHGKNHLNLRTNSLKPGDNDAGQFYQFFVRPILLQKIKNKNHIF